MKHLGILAGLMAMSPAIAAEESMPIKIPSEDHYYLVAKSGTDAKPTLVVKRVSATGTSYAKRAFDCEARTAMHLGSGETLEAMEKAAPSPAPGMKPLTADSVTEQLWHWVCRK